MHFSSSNRVPNFEEICLRTHFQLDVFQNHTHNHWSRSFFPFGILKIVFFLVVNISKKDIILAISKELRHLEITFCVHSYLPQNCGILSSAVLIMCPNLGHLWQAFDSGQSPPMCAFARISTNKSHPWWVENSSPWILRIEKWRDTNVIYRCLFLHVMNRRSN